MIISTLCIIYVGQANMDNLFARQLPGGGTFLANLAKLVTVALASDLYGSFFPSFPIR